MTLAIGRAVRFAADRDGTSHLLSLVGSARGAQTSAPLAKFVHLCRMNPFYSAVRLTITLEHIANRLQGVIGDGLKP